MPAYYLLEIPAPPDHLKTIPKCSRYLIDDQAYIFFTKDLHLLPATKICGLHWKQQQVHCFLLFQVFLTLQIRFELISCGKYNHFRNIS